MRFRFAAALALYLSGPAFATTVGTSAACAAYLGDFYSATYFEVSRYWTETPLKETALATRPDGVARAQALAKAIFDPREKLFETLRPAITHWAAHPHSLKVVYRSNELMYYSEDYHRFAERVDGLLPQGGNILSLGGGTGWLEGYLIRRAPSRSFFFVENHPDVIHLAQKRMMLLLPDDGMVRFKEGVVGPLSVLPDDYFNGVVSNYYYYRLSPTLKDQFFARVSASMRSRRDRDKPASRFVMTEPIRGRESQALPYTLRTLRQAIEKGAPTNDFDAAIFALTTSAKIGSAMTGTNFPQPAFVEAKAIIRAAADEELVLVNQFPSEDGMADTFVFEKR